MPGLLWRSNPFTLSPASQDIGEVYSGIESGLPALGYTEITKQQDDVLGVKGDFFVVVAYIHQGGSNFIRLVMLAFDGSPDAAEAEIQSVIQTIDSLLFL